MYLLHGTTFNKVIIFIIVILFLLFTKDKFISCEDIYFCPMSTTLLYRDKVLPSRRDPFN